MAMINGGGAGDRAVPRSAAGARAVPRARGEWARHWRYAGLPGLDLLRARYVEHSFPRHAHDGFVICVVTSGIEEVGLQGGTVRAGHGGIVMINPEVPHTARAGAPEGWTYATLYPSADLVAGIARETTALRGTAGFVRTVADEPRIGRMIAGIHRAAEAGNALAADSLLRVALAHLLCRHGGPLPPLAPRTAGARTAARARAVLEERMADPPTLEQLARELDTGPFALLRAFKSAYGMPPHTWLTDARVRRARRLLEEGRAPAETAVVVGFTDQPHLNRHFTRIVGVPPGAYRRERAAADRPDGGGTSA
ncbi:AraC family transcriptional regulator [Streptomyces sp. YGL11-2]|uniref:AraC family transcriptional regulator n=1 Tax=Streptomyces sp. YGL11-2 TaxID=3414028 RepID=UPI003CEC17E6